jgi:hypothetical protein
MTAKEGGGEVGEMGKKLGRRQMVFNTAAAAVLLME